MKKSTKNIIIIIVKIFTSHAKIISILTKLVTMQAKSPTKSNTIRFWDTVHVEYPVRKFPNTEVTSETKGRQWKGPPEVLKSLKHPVDEIREYMRDYNITKQLTKSQSTADYGPKVPETQIFNKHTSCTENKYIYPPNRLISDKPPLCNAHGTTEMKKAYQIPETLVYDKDAFKFPQGLAAAATIEPSRAKEIEPIDNTHEGYEVYLDPYLTTNRLLHRPFTADQLTRPSVKKDIMTFHTFSKEPWVRSPKPETEEWNLLINLQKSMCDREKSKFNWREMKTHKKQFWVPGSFRTEVRDNFTPLKYNTLIHNYEEDVKVAYKRAMANVPTLIPEEVSSITKTYMPENTHYGSGRPLSAVIQQHRELNKRL